ncbi:hypothetical protein DFH07DRAFT_347978 [Mycena maculata]|uniref:Uncharacterized protein n=1 Tax=Mycena maculata TaxID=230809 RepID=A0AAD7HBD5_9AGAR|nr:hypothetical protein DFH07DRAFT_347978 [Mycena maculata]
MPRPSTSRVKSQKPTEGADTARRVTRQTAAALAAPDETAQGPPPHPFAWPVVATPGVLMSLRRKRSLPDHCYPELRATDGDAEAEAEAEPEVPTADPVSEVPTAPVSDVTPEIAVHAPCAGTLDNLLQFMPQDRWESTQEGACVRIESRYLGSHLVRPREECDSE